MHSVDFVCYGHANVIGDHRTTLEITTEDFLTRQGTCIIGIRGTMTLDDLDSEIKALAKSTDTRIVLTLEVGEQTERIQGWGSPGLSYSNNVSMVARTSSFECDRTLMVRADKAAVNLEREFVNRLQDSNVQINCRLEYITES